MDVCFSTFNEDALNVTRFSLPVCDVIGMRKQQRESQNDNKAWRMEEEKLASQK